MQQHSKDDGRGKRVRDVGRNCDANDAGIENGDRDYVEYTLSSMAAASAYSGRRVSPFARSTAEPKLYARKNTLPAK